MREDVLERLRIALAASGRGVESVHKVAEAMRACGLVVTDEGVIEAMRELRKNSTGSGPLDDLLAEPGVSDVLVNGANQVFVDRGRGLEPWDIGFADDAQVRRLAVRLAALAGRRLDDASPFVDGRLPDGTRLHAVLAPISQPGTCLSLRVPARRGFSLDELVAAGSLPPAGAQVLRAIVTKKIAFLVSGGTGSGKTTLLAALLALVNPAERVLIVEDSAELVPDHRHCVRLEGRPANSEGAGAITLTQLVRQALRMRPDRVVLGEVRGGEICDLLAALNTGHEGGCGTVHANSISDVMARLEALAALGGLGRSACHAQVGAALSLVVHVARAPDGRRRLAEIGAFVAGPDGHVQVVPAITFSGSALRWEPGGLALKQRLDLG